MNIPVLAAACGFFLIAGLSSCATARKGLTYVAGAGAGAAAGYHFSDGDPLWTAAGAVGGTALAAGANALGDAEVQKAKDEGYAAGQGDAVRQHYWMLQRNQQNSREAEYGTENTYNITIPPGTDAYGVRRVARDATVRIIE
ncbi:MAG: hypothetical protein V4726_00130 [Verrucomicrobiota bacterium]